jgi:hypothetical protein
MKVIVLLALAFALLSGTSALADIYKWTDSNGKLHFSDRPPTDQQSGEIHLKAESTAIDQQTNESPVSYKSCSEVRAAGKAPIRLNDPGYGKHLDRDGDGIACE